MKMKVQKALFKKVILLMLLLWGGMDDSFSAVKTAATEQEQELLIVAEFGEELQDIRDGSLPTVTSFQPFRFRHASSLLPCQILSREETKKSTAYIQFAQTIEPALTPTQIIYPFHFFL